MNKEKPDFSQQKQKFDFKVSKVLKKNNVSILFIGQPNVGKSSLLNALVGTKIEVSNFPGTSVEITQAKKTFKVLDDNQEVQNIEYIFKDTPGIYSISDRSAEETLTKKEILSEDNDVVIIIADGTALDRSLYFTLQVLESGKKNVILGINFVEDAYKKGIIIDRMKLSKILGIPVIPFNPTTKNVEKLIVAATENVEKPSQEVFTSTYDDHIEELIIFVSETIKGEQRSKFIALRILEDDSDFLEFLNSEQKHLVNEKKKEIIHEHPNIKEDIAKTRYGTAAFIAEQVTDIIKVGKPYEDNISLMDKILLHRFLGPLFTLIFFVGLFYVLLIIGGEIEGIFIKIGESIVEEIPETGLSIGSINTVGLFREGLTGCFAGVAIALPYVLLFYLILGFAEDIGLLPRFVVNIQKLFEYFKLPSKGFISMILGLGCTVPAYSSTRIMNRRSDRLKVAMLFAFIPCSSRIGIIMGIIGFYGNILLVLAVFTTNLLGMIIWTFLINLTIKDQIEPMLIELPPYRKPIIKNVFSKSWIRMEDFVKVVVPLLAIGGIFYSLFDQLGITTLLIAPFIPIMSALFNLPGETIVPLVFGFIQKDMTGAMLLSALENSGGISQLTNLQLYTFGVISTIGVPCIIALGMSVKEFGLKNSLIMFLALLVYGIIIASFVWRIVLML